MKPLYLRAFVSSIAMLALAGVAAAQDRAALLTSIEVKALVASGQPTDHARLRDHFAALATAFEADAQRHRVVAQIPPGNPNHSQAIPPSAYEAQRAESSMTSARTLSALSDHHGRLAAGLVSTAPANSAAFENGGSAPEPTEAHVRELVAGARMTAEHRILDEYYASLADRLTTRAQEHAAMATRYRAHPNDRSGNFIAWAAHCERLAKLARDSAEAARASSAEQRKLASQA